MERLEGRNVLNFISPSFCDANNIVLLPLDLEAKHHGKGKSSTTPLLFEPLPIEALHTYPIDPHPYTTIDKREDSCYTIKDYATIKDDSCESYPPFRLKEIAIKLERWIHLAPRTHRYYAVPATLTHIGIWYPSMWVLWINPILHSDNPMALICWWMHQHNRQIVRPDIQHLWQARTISVHGESLFRMYRW